MAGLGSGGQELNEVLESRHETFASVMVEGAQDVADACVLFAT